MSYEKDIQERIEDNQGLPKKIDISMIKYFWQSNPLANRQKDSIPRFLRKITVLKNFSDNELRILSRFLHVRSFGHNETVFKQNEIGVGFYFVFSGYVDICVDKELEGDRSHHLLTLERHDYFGELALLQDKSIRNASAISREGCELIGIFKPDVEDLIAESPVVAAKLLQSVSIIVANRLFHVTNEVKELNFKLSLLEKNQNNGEEQSGK